MLRFSNMAKQMCISPPIYQVSIFPKQMCILPSIYQVSICPGMDQHMSILLLYKGYLMLRFSNMAKQLCISPSIYQVSIFYPLWLNIIMSI